MPTYQYECGACEHTFEILQSMMDKKIKKCPSCGKNKLHRLIGAGSGIIFKGTGFYETDYKKKGPSSGAGTSGKEEKTAEISKPKTEKSPSSTPEAGKTKAARST